MAPGRRRVLEIIAAILAGVQLGLMVIYWRVMTQELHMNDFGKFYYATQAFLAGGDMYGPTVATAVPFGENATREFWNMNPPHFHLLVLPLALLPPPQAIGLWFAAGFFCLVLSLLLIARELEVTWRPQTVFYAALAVLLPSATGMVVVTAQVTFLLMLPMTLAWLAARRGDWSRAGLLLGLAASVKPFLGLFWLYLIIRRQVRAAVLMAAAAIGFALTGLAVFGVSAYAAWMEVTSRVDWLWVPMNASVPALLARTISSNPIYEPLVDASAATSVLSAGLAAIILLITGFTLARQRPGVDVDEDVAFAAVMVTALLISPLGWMYYLPLAAGPLVAWLLAQRAPVSRAGRLLLILALPGIVLPPIVTALGVHLPFSGLVLGSVYTWTMLLLWLVIVRDAPRHRRREAAEAA